MVIFTHILRSDTMAWKDILKRRNFNDPRKGKKGGLTDEQRRKYYGYDGSKAAEEAKRRRDALNDPEMKEKFRINKLKAKAESKIKRLDESVKALEYEVKYLGENYSGFRTKPEEHDAGVEWEKSKDITSNGFYETIAEMEQKRGYADFLRESIKSNFKGVSMNEYQERRGNMYSIRIDDDLGLRGSIYEGEELGNWENRTKEVFNRLMRELGWDDKVMEQ